MNLEPSPANMSGSAEPRASADWRADPLAFLIAPLPVDAFLRDHYERRPLLNAVGQPDRFADLLSLESLGDFIASADLKEGMLDLAKHEDPVPRERYIEENGRINAAAVALEYGRGATIVMPQLSSSMYRLGQFCRALEERFSCHVAANIYLTPPGNQGFPSHYDNHDVIVLQIAGRKNWRLYETAIETPYRGERFEYSGFKAEQVSFDFTLEPGDCVYVPRGVMHDAQNVGDEPSLHITLGFFTKKWADLVLEAVSELALSEPDFRRSLPPGFATRDFDRERAREHFERLLDLVADKASIDGAFDLMSDNFVRARRPDVGGIVAAGPLALQPGDRFRLRRFVPWNVADDEGRIVLVGPGADIRFEAEAGDALDIALSGKPFGIEELACADPEELLRALWTHGYLERCGA